MSLITTEFAGHAGALRRTPLFERVSSFRFAGARSGRMVTRRCDIGAVTVALVESTGHDIGLEETKRGTFLAPLGGMIGLVSGGAESRLPQDGGALIGPGFPHHRRAP